MQLTADQMRGRVRILIDGEERVLRYDQDALMHVIGKLGLEGLAALPMALRTFDNDVLRVFVWAGCLHDDPELTDETVGGWFFPMLPTYMSVIEGVNLAIWGHPEGDQDDDAEEVSDAADPTTSEIEATAGTSEPPSGSQSGGSG